MFLAEFLAGGRDAELQIRMGYFGCVADFAAVERFLRFGGLEARAAVGGAVLIHAVSKKGGTKKEKVVSEAHDDHHFGRERP